MWMTPLVYFMTIPRFVQRRPFPFFSSIFFDNAHAKTLCNISHQTDKLVSQYLSAFRLPSQPVSLINLSLSWPVLSITLDCPFPLAYPLVHGTALSLNLSPLTRIDLYFSASLQSLFFTTFCIAIRGGIQRKKWLKGTYAVVAYNLTLYGLQTWLQHIYRGQPYDRVDFLILC